MKTKKLIIASVLAVVVLGFGFAASAQTTDIQALIAQLQAQIASLMAQLQTLQAQQNGTQAWCHTFNTNMGVGYRGCPTPAGGGGWAGCNYNGQSDEIESLYKVLEKEGFITYDNADVIATKFGESTASAVVQFQEKYFSEILAPYNLKHGTGYVGSSTRAKLNKLYGCNQTQNQPSIVIASPAGGETWKVGETHDITWTSSGIDTVSIWVGSTTGAWSMNAHDIANDISASSGKYSWTIGKYDAGNEIPRILQIVGRTKAGDTITATSKSFYVNYIVAQTSPVIEFQNNNSGNTIYTTTRAIGATGKILDFQVKNLSNERIAINEIVLGSEGGLQPYNVFGQDSYGYGLMIDGGDYTRTPTANITDTGVNAPNGYRKFKIDPVIYLAPASSGSSSIVRIAVYGKIKNDTSLVGQTVDVGLSNVNGYGVSSQLSLVEDTNFDSWARGEISISN